MAYKLQAICLIVEHRTCQNCNRAYDFPSNVVLKLFDSNNNKTVLSNPKINYLTLDLPRERRIVNTSVPSCQECFHERDIDHNQFHLFQEQKQEYGLEMVELDGVSQRYVMQAALTQNQRANWLGGKDKGNLEVINGKVVEIKAAKKDKKAKPALPTAAAYF